MKLLRKMIGLFVGLLLSLAPVPVLAAGQTIEFPPPPPPPQMALSGICADSTYLYVIAHGKILQYKLADMSLLQTVDLPELAPPSDAPPPPPPPPKSTESGTMPPPPPHHMGMPHGAWVGSGSLYILAGHLVFQYSTTDLTLKATTELPPPEPPPGS